MRRSVTYGRVLLGLLAGALTASAQVQIHLPREIQVQDSPLKLGGVAVVRGDPAMAETASQIGLGSLIVPSQKVTIDRATILSRLASNGIPCSQVTFTGADKVVVGRSGKTVKGQDLADVARQFIQKTAASTGLAQIEVASPPKDLIIDGNHPAMQLVPRLGQGSRSGAARVRVAVVCGDTEVAGQDVLLRLRYKGHKVVALSDLAKGTVLSAENCRIEEGLSDQPQPANWKPPYGGVLKRTVVANTEIRSDGLSDPVSDVTIKRNEPVVIRVERPGLSITAMGRMMADGHAGQIVKVRNVDSNRIIVCKVMSDGSVEPVF